MAALGFFATAVWALTASASGIGQSPNGVIAFAGAVKGGFRASQVFVINPDGSHLRQVTHSSEYPQGADISSTGKRITFFQATFGPGPFQVFRINSDGSNQVQLTHAPSPGADDPSFSPDGKRIAFTEVVGNQGPQVFIMNADGSHQKQLTHVGGRHPDADYASFSPNGRKILFNSSHCGICEMNADGSDQRTLSQHGFEARFSPDGRKIVYLVETLAFSPTRPFPTATDHIFVMNADGSSRVQLTHSSVQLEFPCFSPDGKSIAFTGQVQGHNGFEISVMNADGSHQRQITHVQFAGAPSWAS